MKFAITPLYDAPAEAAYQAPRRATGVEWSRRLSPDTYDLWLCVSQLRKGARLTWDADHGDDGIYVIDGELACDDRTVPAGGALIVESGAAALAVAETPATIVHVGTNTAAPPGPLGDPSPDEHGTHVVGPDGWFTSGQREGVSATWFADGTCPTCRIQLFTVEGPPDTSRKAKGHSHSQSEIIYVLDGSLHMGSYDLAPGTALCIPADARYAIRGGLEGHRFLNYRAGVSEQRYGRLEEPILETALSRGGSLVGDLR